MGKSEVMVKAESDVFQQLISFLWGALSLPYFCAETQFSLT